MSGQPHIKDQFEYPTLRQNHKTGKWETVIGRRNLHTAAERLMAGLLANSEVMWIDDAGQTPDMDKLVKIAVKGAIKLLNEVEKNITYN